MIVFTWSRLAISLSIAELVLADGTRQIQLLIPHPTASVYILGPTLNGQILNGRPQLNEWAVLDFTTGAIISRYAEPV